MQYCLKSYIRYANETKYKNQFQESAFMFCNLF